jgi:hypothetical protein
MSEDMDALKNKEKHIQEACLPMSIPKPKGIWKKWKTYKGIPISPQGSISYDPQKGARWL